jgi:hypothetical protein
MTETRPRSTKLRSRSPAGPEMPHFSGPAPRADVTPVRDWQRPKVAADLPYAPPPIPWAFLIVSMRATLV